MYLDGRPSLKDKILDVLTFERLRDQVVQAGYGEEIIWSESLSPCNNADLFFAEYMWVVLNSGMKNQIAKKIQYKIWDALKSGKAIGDVFNHKGKTKAIEQILNNKELYFSLYQSAEDKLNFLESLPYIGSITKYHLAKNLGLDTAKPDRHLQRISQKYNSTPQLVCEKLASETNYRISTVDLIIWRAANLGYV